LVTDWAPSPPAPVLAGAGLVGPVVGPVVGAVVAELEPELELLLQPDAASTAAATAAKPILLSLRTVVPPGVGRSCRFISPKRRGSAGFAGHGRGPPAAASGFRQAGQAVAPWPSQVASRNLDELPQERLGVKYPSTILKTIQGHNRIKCPEGTY
jgi:hypothetical protein